ncbi:unnamed protein product [Adineta ricciae]|uniref:LicD/FKTN/FKRP nucleotidyltransferase domain-containing protein n=1 Tax=Adineta ricciae TaxID=249248 RepID=A0A815XZ78_ADIRI|nr:unnamed protein product [Adineta ricciae]CAF1563601.1 unnamed protein product [Adineta ricciae]
MALYLRKFRRLSYIFQLISLAIVILLIKTYVRTNQCVLSPPVPVLILSSPLETSSNTTTNDHLWIWCQDLQFHFDAEKHIPSSPTFRSPSIINQRTHRLPYRYSNWKSSPLLARRFTPCEHYIAMSLLMFIDRICREHGLTFAIADGTLLGSWRHHDIIPWDDDVDIMMPIEDQLSFLHALEQYKDTVIQYHLLEYPRNNTPYAKVFFQYKPFAIQDIWSFPFVDIFFYLTNKTHLWYANDPGVNMRIEHVFPLIMRPLGSLWLPAPHGPQFIFGFDVLTQCNSHWYDHRKEKGQPYVKRNCSDLTDAYPFVQYDERNNPIEILVINGTVIHTIMYS